MINPLHKFWQERSCLTRRQSNRREMDNFFAESLDYLYRHPSGECLDDFFGAMEGGDILSEGLAAFSFKKFGALASNVLRHWGIDSPDELELAFYEFLRACGSRTLSRAASGFAQSEALKALFRGDYWP